MDARISMGIAAALAGAAGLLTLWLVRPVEWPEVEPAQVAMLQGARPTAGKPARAPAPEISEERAAARVEYREDRLLEVDLKLGDHAARAGWDPETTEEVRAVLLDTSDRITRAMARVDQGQATWEQISGRVQSYRMQQARQVRDILGQERFEAFVADMGFERF